MNEKPMTRSETEDLIRMTALEFSNVLTEKLAEFSKEQREEHRLSREQVFEQATGYPWEHRSKFKSIIAWAASMKDTSNIWRNAGIIAIIGVAIKAFWKDLTGG